MTTAEFPDLSPAPANPGASGPLRFARVDVVDVVRGIIMVLMALDHTRDYFGNAAASPTNLATTTVALFLTRWITHFCAPTFFLLTGTGAYLGLRRRTTAELSRFLITRGLWLVLLELTVIRFLWQFNLDYRLTLIDVIWALGWAMVVLGVLIYLPLRAIAAFGLVLIATHNLFDGVGAGFSGALSSLWTLLHVPGFLVKGPPHVVFSAYPLIPWIGVTAVGFALGALWDQPVAVRRSWLLRFGVACIALFFVLRGFNIYGDPGPWTAQPRGVMTLLSFLNVNKYPPSLLFLLMTLGPVLLVIRALDGRTLPVLEWVRIIGRVPFFYYLMHVLVLHLLVAGAMVARFGVVSPALESPSLDRFPITQPPGWPVSLPVVYVLWGLVVVVLYPMCRWYSDLKRRSSSPWLSYL